MPIILSDLNPLKKFTGKFPGKFLAKRILKLPPHLAHVATLPCETLTSAKLTINDTLQACAATCFRCGGVVDDRIRKGILLSLSVIFLNR